MFDFLVEVKITTDWKGFNKLWVVRGDFVKSNVRRCKNGLDAFKQVNG